MTANPISMTVVNEAIRQQGTSLPGSEMLTKKPALSELFAISMVSGLGNDAVDDYVRSTAKPESLARGRSKSSDGDENAKVEEPVAPTMDPITRPNGELYYPRMWGNQFDVQVLAKGREHSKYALLMGEPGTGKTVLGEAAFGTDMYTVMITGDTSVDELVGSWAPKPEGGFMWVDGPLVRAAEEGKIIFLDEIGLADPKVLSALYSLMDGRRELMVTSNPNRGVVKAIDGFYVIAATNPHAPGVRLSEALLSRFSLHAEVTTDYEMALRLGVPKKVVGAAQNISKRQRDGLTRWAPQFRDLLQFRDLNDIFGLHFACQNMIASAPEMDRAQVTEVLMLVTGQKELASAKI